MAALHLNSGLIALVDDADFPRVSALTWRAHKADQCIEKWYVYTYVRGRKIYLHRFVVDVPKGLEVDHINRDGLDNRRGNLRLCTKSENCSNARSQPNQWGFRGVFHRSKDGKFQGRVYVQGKALQTACYSTPHEAALARDAIAKRAFGDFAILNFSNRSAA